MSQGNGTVDLSAIGFARLDEYFGLWSIEPTRGLALFDRGVNTDLLSHVLASATPRLESKLQTIAVAGSDAQGATQIAVINVRGNLMKQQSSFDSSSSTVQLRRDITNAANDPTIGGILLVIDSPGGSVAGTADLAAAVAAADKKKPVHAYGEDLVASAALWVASQASRFTANHATALIGSIGTFIGTYDVSGAAAMKGMKAKVYATGPLKGAGFPGTEITPEQDAYFQGIVDQTQTHFAEAVAAGRRMSLEKVKELATGGVFVAQNALKQGLIDGIETFEAAMSALSAAIHARAVNQDGRVATGKDVPMSTNTAPVAGASAPTEASTATVVTAPAPTAEPTATSVVTAPNAVAAEAKRFLEAFGVQSSVYMAEGLTFEAAQTRHLTAMKAENDALKAKLAGQSQVVEALRGEAAPVNGTPDPKETPAVAAGDVAKYQGILSDNMARYAAGIVLPTK
jgi:signal peptide peptidase SppA